MVFHVFRVSGVVKKSIPLVAWSGSFLASVVKSLMSMDEVLCGFTISPLQVFSSNGLEVVLSGLAGSRAVVLDAGSRVVFRVTSFCREAPANFVSSLGNADAGFFTISSIDYEAVEDFSFSRVENYVDFIDVSSRAVVDVFFYPTILVFRGWRILYPSPQRIVFGLARSAVELLHLDPRAVRRRARILARNIELVSDRTRVVTLNIGRKRAAKAFMGKARFGVYGLENLRDFVDLLRFGTLIGIGKSRGIGFGFYKYRILRGKQE